MADPQAPWLAIDSATDTAGIALHDGRQLLVEHHWSGRRRHTIEIGPAIEKALAQQNLEARNLGGIAVTIGPGSYTGLRIGLSLAKGLAMGGDLPLLGVPTLDVLAFAMSPPHCPRSRPLWAVLQAGRGRVVAARYPVPGSDEVDRTKGWPEAGELRVQTVADLAKVAAVGDWVAGEIDATAQEVLAAAGLLVLSPAAGLRRTGWLAELALERFRAGAIADAERLAPIYPASE